jgi:hypothetical protein
MDTCVALAALGPAIAARVHCVAGRGTMFINRDWTGPSKFVEMLSAYDGSNGPAVMAALLAQGYLHSAIPDPQTCVIGICGEAEMATVAATLAPAAEKVVKGHLLGLGTDGAGGALELRLRGLDGAEARRPLPDGAFIVNCTDNCACSATVS